MERLDNLPRHLKGALTACLGVEMGSMDYTDGFVNGAVMLYKAIQSFEATLHAEALKRTERWFEEEVVPNHSVEEIYTDDLEEVHGYVFLSNVRGEWANEFFDRLELEKKSLRDVYCKEGTPEGVNTEKG